MILFIRKREKSKPHENICKHHDYCCVILPEEGKNIVQYNQDKKNLKIPFITYADMESLLEKLHVCHNIADCMKRFRADLKKHTTEIINYKKNEMLPLTEDKIESHNNKSLRGNSNVLEKTLKKYNFFSTNRKTRNEKTIK